MVQLCRRENAVRDQHPSLYTLPDYFQQRSEIPDKNYTALFPIYGRIKQRFFRDEIKFALFPLYGQTRKKGVTTDNYLYPVFHLRHGNGVHGWQVWPLLGDERLTPTTRTNAWGDIEPVGGFHKFFALWPIFWWNKGGIGSTNQILQHSVLPLYTYLRSPLRDSTTYLWPLGLTHTVDREKKYNEWGAPWPLIVFTRGEGRPLIAFFHSIATRITRLSPAAVRVADLQIQPPLFSPVGPFARTHSLLPLFRH
jgi:hypothetical protein